MGFSIVLPTFSTEPLASYVDHSTPGAKSAIDNAIIGLMPLRISLVNWDHIGNQGRASALYRFTVARLTQLAHRAIVAVRKANQKIDDVTGERPCAA
jgi:hypothetical protein